MARRLLLVAVLVLACARPASAAIVSPGFGAWCWFADPRAIAYDGRVVFGWVDGSGSIMVGDTSGRISTLHHELGRDDHDNPAFYVRKDGRLMAFWSAHAGPALYYRTASRDLSHWGPVRTAPANPGGEANYTYPNPVRIGDTLYLFWSGAGFSATYATSTDDGETWSEARSLFYGTPVRYIKYRADGEAIHMAWTLSHPRNRASGVYHAVIRDGRIRRQNGRHIGTLGTPMSSSLGDVVYDQSEGPAWIHDLAVRDGVPAIVYATFPSLGRHVYRYATHKSPRWRNEDVVAAGPSFNPDPVEPHYSGGITLDPADPATVYLSRTVLGAFEVERWVRRPPWRRAEAVTSGSSVKNVRPFPVAGGVAWMRGAYESYLTFETQIAWQPPAPPPAPVPGPQPPAAPPPAPPPAAPQAALAAPAPAPAGCRLYGRRVMRHGRVSCGTAKRVLRRHLLGRASPGWRCYTVTRAHCRRRRAHVSVAHPAHMRGIANGTRAA